MRRLYYSLFAALVLTFSARAQESSSSIRFAAFDWSKVEEYHWGADTLEALYAKPLWGVKRLKARLIDRETSKPITKNIVVRCAPCEDKDAYMEWNTNAKGGWIDMEIPCFGTDSFYVRLQAGPYEPVVVRADASHRKGDAIDIGTFHVKNLQKEIDEMMANKTVDWSKLEDASSRKESWKRWKWPSGALARCTRLELSVEDEAGQPVQARVKVEPYPNGRSTRTGFDMSLNGLQSCDKKGHYSETFICGRVSMEDVPIDSFYISVHHPYMETVRKLVTEEHKNGPYLRVGTIVMKRKPAILPSEKE